MTSHSDVKKKRIARVGNDNPKDNTSHGGDVVAGIIKAMDSNAIYKERGIISYKQLQDYRSRDQKAQNSSGFSFNHLDKISTKQSKKFLPERKHPLMAKCQKNLKYIKHNRSLPKPRAHVGIIPVPSTKPTLKSKNLVLLKEENRKNKGKSKIKNKSKKDQVYNVAESTNKVINGMGCDTIKPHSSSISYNADELINDSIQNHSDSDSDFESFIRSQKQCIESYQSDSDFSASDFIYGIPKPKKRKKQTHRSSENTSNSKISRPRKIKAKELKKSNLSKQEKISQATIISEIDEIPPDPICEEENKSNDCDMNFDCDICEDTSDSVCSDRSLKLLSTKNGDEVQVFDSNFSIDLSKPESQCFILRHFSCIVKMLRNPILDKELLSDISLEATNANNMLSQLEDFSSHSSSFEPQINTLKEVAEVILDDSDDDCAILFEIPKSNASSLPKNAPASSISSVPSESNSISRGSPVSSFCQQHANASLDSAHLSRMNLLNINETVISPSIVKIDNPSVIYGNPASNFINTQCVLQQNSSQTLCSTSKNNEDSYSNFNITPEEKLEIDNTELNIQILSVTSLTDNCTSNDSHNHRDLLDYSASESTALYHIPEGNHLNSKENASNNTNLKRSSNGTDIGKDHFKYANVYCEIPNSVSDNLNDNIDISNNITSVHREVGEVNEQTGDCISVPKIDDILDKIDIKTINKILEQFPNNTEIHNPDAILSTGRDISPSKLNENCFENNSTPRFDSSTSNSCNISQSCNPSENYSSVIPDILNKIDFKEILTLANSKNTIPNNEENCTAKENSVQTFSPSTESLNTQQVTSKTFKDGLVASKSKFQINETLWKHIKSAVVTNNNLPESSSINSTNSSNYPTKINHEASICDLSTKDTNALLFNQSNIKRATMLQATAGSSIEIVQKRNERKDIIKGDPIKAEKHFESPSDELDIFAATSIRELSEPKQKDVIPLFNLYTNELKKYKEIMSTERNVSAGLKMLEENQANRIKYLETAIRNIVKHDPCFYKVAEEAKLKATTRKQCNSSNENKIHSAESTGAHSSHQKDLLEDPSTSLEKPVPGHDTSRQMLICSNCPRAAVFKCQGCEKAYFCSKDCGISYWKEIHHLNCS